MTDKSRTRVIVDVDANGRVSLGRFGFKSTQVVVDQLEGGGLVLHEAMGWLTQPEAAHYADPKAIDSLKEASRPVNAGKTRKLTLRSQHKT